MPEPMKCPRCGSELGRGDGSRIFFCTRKGCTFALKSMWWGEW